MAPEQAGDRPKGRGPAPRTSAGAGPPARRAAGERQRAPRFGAKADEVLRTADLVFGPTLACRALPAEPAWRRSEDRPARPLSCGSPLLAPEPGIGPIGAAGLTSKPHHARRPTVALCGSFRLRLASTCNHRPVRNEGESRTVRRWPGRARLDGSGGWRRRRRAPPVGGPRRGRGGRGRRRRGARAGGSSGWGPHLTDRHPRWWS